MPSTFAAIGTALGATASSATSVGLAATSVGVGAIGANVQYQAGQRAAEAQQAAANVQNRRQNIQALREAQIRRAMLQQQSANAGTLGSSGFAGGQSSLQSQLGSNLGFANTMRMYGNQANAAQRTASNAGAITGLVQSGLSFANQYNQNNPNALDSLLDSPASDPYSSTMMSGLGSGGRLV